MIISVRSGKTFDKLQQSIQVNILCKIGLEENYLYMININNNKNNNKYNTKQQKGIIFPVKSGRRNTCSLFPLLFSFVLEIQVNLVRQEIEIIYKYRKVKNKLLKFFGRKRIW